MNFKELLKNKKTKDLIIYVFAGLMGFLVFMQISYGKVLNIKNVNWLLGTGDSIQHYLGWIAYRQSGSVFPLAMTDRLFYPHYFAIMYTDSLPLLAVIFKIIGNFIKGDFQYVGLWLCACYILQAVFAARLLKHFNDGVIPVVLGSVFFVLCPVLWMRSQGHSSLCGLWLILWALDFLFGFEEYAKDRKKCFVNAVLIGFLAASSHLYIYAMAGMVLFSFAIQVMVKKKDFALSGITLLSYILTGTFTIGLFGGFSSSGTSFSGGGLGQFNMNLNALVNPLYYSDRFLPKLSLYNKEQYEGFGYLGVGIIILCIAAVCIKILYRVLGEKRKLMPQNSAGLGVGILIVLTVIVACQNSFTLGSVKLFSIGIPGFLEKIWSCFRASGRMVMVLVLLATLLGVGGIIKGISNKTLATLFLLVCALTQITELGAIAKSLEHFEGGHMFVEEKPEPEAFWDVLARDENIKHLVITDMMSETDYYRLGKWALENGKTMSSFASARTDDSLIHESAMERVFNPEEGEIFIIPECMKAEYLKEAYGLYYYEAGEYYVAVKTPIEGFKAVREPDLP